MAGGGGSDNSATERQDAIERQKAEARRQLNAQFGVADAGSDLYDQAQQTKAGRDSLYQTVRDNAFNAGKTSLDEKYADAQRKNKFSLFAQGLNGGSEDVDQSALLGRTYNQGLLDLGSQADAAKSTLQGNDETSRLQLLNAINAGTDQSSALSSALNQMQTNYDTATANANGTNLGDLFATSGALYTKNNAAAGKQAATDWWNTYNPVSSSSKKASTGTLSVG